MGYSEREPCILGSHSLLPTFRWLTPTNKPPLSVPPHEGKNKNKLNKNKKLFPSFLWKRVRNKNKKERQGVLRSQIKHQTAVGRRLHLTRKRELIVDFVGNLSLGVSCNLPLFRNKEHNMLGRPFHLWLSVLPEAYHVHIRSDAPYLEWQIVNTHVLTFLLFVSGSRSSSSRWHNIRKIPCLRCRSSFS